MFVADEETTALFLYFQVFLLDDLVLRLCVRIHRKHSFRFVLSPDYFGSTEKMDGMQLLL